MTAITVETALEKNEGEYYDCESGQALAAEVRRLRAELSREKERADYAWKNTNIIEQARQKCEADLSAARADAFPQQPKIYCWLGYWRDKMPAQAVTDLQDILSPPQGRVRRRDP